MLLNILAFCSFEVDTSQSTYFANEQNMNVVDASNVTQSVQLSLAPVFFLTAVAGMIAVVAGRLARIIDRARVVEQTIHSSNCLPVMERGLQELGYLRSRGRLANLSIGLLTLCGFLIGLTIVLLFLREEWGVRGQHVAVFSFLAGVVSFICALAGFLWETVLATQLLDFNVQTLGRKLRQEMAQEQEHTDPPAE